MLIAAGLFAGAAAAQASSGITVTPNQETLVTPGMTAVEIQQTLGKPALKRTFGNEPGPTWTYRVAGTRDTEFDIDFDAQGKVLSMSEREEGSEAEN
jgi:outer membrane protein assembly factor BamE (lipoprotein component of BamABCDE complex)